MRAIHVAKADARLLDQSRLRLEYHEHARTAETSLSLADERAAMGLDQLPRFRSCRCQLARNNPTTAWSVYTRRNGPPIGDGRNRGWG